MGKAYSVVFDTLILSRDLAKLEQGTLKCIRRTVETKLITRPEIYGKPLRSPLQGYWTLRVGDYRIVYHIRKKIVYVDIVEHRAVIYGTARARLEHKN